MKHYKNQQGFGIIEIIVAVALFITIAVTGLTTVIGSFTSNRLGNEHTKATLYAQEGLDISRSIKNKGWSTFFTSTNCASGCGVAVNGGSWGWSGLNNTNEKYTRTITVTNVQRNISGGIVESGGANDPDTKKVTATVSWDFTPSRNNSVTLSTYLTNFRKIIARNWANPSVVGSLDLSGSQDAIKIATRGNYAYIVRATGNPDFAIIDISTPGLPILVGSLNLTTTPTNIFIEGTYAYISGGGNSHELRIVDISNPSAPNIVGSYNAPGNADANDIFVIGTTGYLVRSSSGDPEFIVLNLSNPTAINLIGSLNIIGNAQEVVAQGSLAAIATSNDTQEMQLINISTPSSPSIVGSYDASGSNDANAIAMFSTNILVSQIGGNLYLLSAATPSAPTLISTYSAGGNVRDIALGNSNNYAFLATTNPNAEFQIIDISSLNAPTLLGNINLTDNVNGIAYNTSLDKACLATSINNAEYSEATPN